MEFIYISGPVFLSLISCLLFFWGPRRNKGLPCFGCHLGIHILQRRMLTRFPHVFLLSQDSLPSSGCAALRNAPGSLTTDILKKSHWFDPSDCATYLWRTAQAASPIVIQRGASFLVSSHGIFSIFISF